MEDRVLALGEIACDVLQRMLRELGSRKAAGHLIESGIDELEVALRLALRGQRADPRRFAADLAANLDRVLDDAIERAASFRPGRVYCHRCPSPACEHSEPPSCRHVFVEYNPTGTPVWRDFAQDCLEQRHPEVDRLYDDPPALVTCVRDRSSLCGRLLEAFRGRRTYDLLGQATAGFFPVRTSAPEGRGVVAVTFQVVASHRRDRGVRLGLNVLGRTPGGESLDLLWERRTDIPWLGAVRWAQSALSSVRSRRRKDREAIERRVEGILQGLARRLARDSRARSRRTRHAERRHRSGQRPTRKAIDDTRGARPNQILVDERNDTMVVPGDRGRIHFFTAEGRHVSSVRYSRDAIERKRKLGLWRDAEAREAEAFLACLSRGQHEIPS